MAGGNKWELTREGTLGWNLTLNVGTQHRASGLDGSRTHHRGHLGGDHTCSHCEMCVCRGESEDAGDVNGHGKERGVEMLCVLVELKYEEWKKRKKGEKNFFSDLELGSTPSLPLPAAGL